MTATALLEQVRLLGVEVFAVGDRLRLQPRSRLSPELIETLRTHKPELLAELRAERWRDGEGVGPWQPAGRTTRHCPNCDGGLQPGEVDGDLCFTCRWPGMPTRPQ